MNLLPRCRGKLNVLWCENRKCVCKVLSVYCLRSPEVGFPKSKSLMTERTRQIFTLCVDTPLLPLSEEGQRPSFRIVLLE
jgi:hypothetical protein